MKPPATAATTPATTSTPPTASTAAAPRVTAPIPAERDRAVGQLTAQEVRAAVAQYLTPGEVAALGRATPRRGATNTLLAELRAGWRGYANRGVICTTLRRGLAVEIGDRGGVVPWPLVAQIVADGATPARLAHLEDALTSGDRTLADNAAHTIVYAGPAATQLDLLDALDGRGNDVVDLDDPTATHGPLAAATPPAQEPVPAASRRPRPRRPSRRSGEPNLSHPAV